ncbi:MAG: alanyl-tRNA editing protein [Lachnospiraceae bacterium]|nr:alanyl-tRNA editing protein [Lachnospiraceae bacterium]
MTEFDAVVIESGKDEKKGSYVVLDRTAFFPGGGGQQADTGRIQLRDESIHTVGDVYIEGGNVRHSVDTDIPAGEKVRGILDSKIRFLRMQIHGAEHLVSGLIHSTFGYDNAGFHMSDDSAVFDVNGPLSDEDIREIEQRANMIVFENRPVTVSFPTPEEATSIEYRSKLDTYENIRLIEIEGIDVCACCAPHVDSTGRLGVIKITDHEPHRGGMRLTLTAGMSAYDDYAALHDRNARIMEMLSSKRELTDEYVKALYDRMMSLKEENGALKKTLTDTLTESVIDRIGKRESGDVSPEIVFTDCLDPVGLRNLVNECTGAFPGTVCAFLSTEGGFRYIFAVRPENAGTADILSLTADFNKACAGKGGGSAVMTQGTTTADRRDIEAFFLSLKA